MALSDLLLLGQGADLASQRGASLRFGVGRPFFAEPLSELVIARTIEPAFFLARV